jgi:chitosanase
VAITLENKKRIQSVLSIIETGNPDGNYADVTIYADGEKGSDGKPTKQITYGAHQTTEQSHLKTLLQLYAKKGGMRAIDMKPFVERMGKEPLWEEKEFIDMLKDAGENDPLMKSAQDEFFDVTYYQKAYDWFEENGFTLPLSLLVIYDSFIHSGKIRDDIRSMFPAKPPVRGGDEKEWISQYVDARHEWLSSRENPILRKTVYRTEGYKLQIAMSNWNLDNKVKMNGMLSRSMDNLADVMSAPKKRPRKKKEA